MIGEPRTPPTAGIFDAPGVSLCLNTEWASHIDGLLQQLLSRKRWEDGTESEIDFAIDQINLLIAKLGDVGVCQLTPIGAMMMWWSNTIPDGWLKMGQNISKTTYPELFAIFGYTYGGGADIFTLPTMAGYSPFGAGAAIALGASGGADTHTLSVDEMPAHNHDVTDPGHNHGVTDPGHVHRERVGNGANAFILAAAGGTNPTVGSGTTTNTVANNTGSATTGISVDNATTGITTENTGGGAPFSLLHPVKAVNFIIFAGH